MVERNNFERESELLVVGIDIQQLSNNDQQIQLVYDNNLLSNDAAVCQINSRETLQAR